MSKECSHNIRVAEQNVINNVVIREVEKYNRWSFKIELNKCGIDFLLLQNEGWDVNGVIKEPSELYEYTLGLNPNAMTGYRWNIASPDGTGCCCFVLMRRAKPSNV